MTRRRLLLGALVLVALAAALVQITIEHPRIHVRWRDDVTDVQRSALEARYRLEAGEPVEGRTWRYDLRDRSPENVGALIADPQIADTAYLDRSTLAVPEPKVIVSARRARMLLGPHPLGFVQLQSGILLAAGAALLWTAGLPDWRRRRATTVGIIAAVGACAFLFPLRQPIRMGDSSTYIETRSQFEGYSGVHHIRFEAHLSHAVLGQLDRLFGRTDGSPARALDTLMRAATVGFVAALIGAGMLERWSPEVVRYLALAAMAPTALLYFGYRELGHLSLNALVFPLLWRGLRDGSRHIEASAALAGFGAALHGFGLLSVAGLALAVAGRGGVPWTDLAARLLRLVAWSIAAYLGWIAIYQIGLKLPILPGHADAIPLRPWFSDVVTDRVNAAIFSLRGFRDVASSALIVGAPLLGVAVSLRRRIPLEVRTALLYSVPSAIFVVMFWPIQGLAVEMDLLVAAFPALYALAWACARSARHAVAAAIVLAIAHIVFWRVALDSAFVNSRIS
jgi:hypothetical protein